MHLPGFQKWKNIGLMKDEVLQLNCWFEGHVQGVGFRYQTVQVAKGFEVTGTVRNLSDGRVHLYAEGEEKEARAFQAEVARELADYIRKIEIKTDFGSRRCADFTILPSS
jgi:acylphosphatase